MRSINKWMMTIKMEGEREGDEEGARREGKMKGEEGEEHTRRS